MRASLRRWDSACDQITIRDGKGAKDRVTMLPTSLKADLREHLKNVKKLHDAPRNEVLLAQIIGSLTVWIHLFQERLTRALKAT